MKFSTTTITTVALAVVVLFGLTFTGFNSIRAQNMTTPNMTGSANMTGPNMTNATGAATAGGSAKMHIEEAVKALESGDKQAASTHLTAAQQAIAGESDQAKMHFGEGMKAFSAGDSNGALMHLKAAIQGLG
jgi:hypothetical protein